jgi:phosphohistidine phosphatase SixA
VIVFLVRHALAEDAARELGLRLRWHDCTPAVIRCSAAATALLTAERVAAAIEWSGVIEREPQLAADGSVEAVLDALAPLDARDAVLLIGHEPTLSALGARLTGRDDFPALRHGQAARIDDGELRWVFGWDDEAPESRP